MNGDGLDQSAIDDAAAKATRAGFEVVRGTPRTLLLDLDSRAAYQQFKRVFPVAEKHFDLKIIRQWSSKSGGVHIELALGRGLGAYRRHALQAAMGSDGVREVLALVRHSNGVDEATMLFKPRKPRMLGRLRYFWITR